MKVSKTKIEKVFRFFQEGADTYDKSYAQKLLGLKDTDGITEKIQLSAKWMLLGARSGEYEIEEEFCRNWNSFVRRLLSPNEMYGYEGEDRKLEDEWEGQEFVRDLQVLSNRVQKLRAMEEMQFRLIERVPESTGLFVGRRKVLEKVHEHLKGEKALVLYGMGGIGKSELAKAYINYYGDYYNKIVFCSFHENLQETFIDDCQIEVENLMFVNGGKRGERGWYFRKKQRILQEITDEKTLLVIDDFNVLSDNRLGDIMDLPCKFLFTSRTSAENLGLPGIRIGALSLFSEQRELFFKYYGREILEEKLPLVDKLIRRLKGHTLSVKLCASYLTEQEDGIECLEDLLTGEERRNIREGPIEKQIQDIFRLTSLTRTERAALRYLSVMPVYGIGLAQFQEWCKVRNMEYIERLAAKGLVEWNRKRGVISLHPLVAASVRKSEKVSFQNCRPYVQTLCRLCHQTWIKSAREKRSYERYVYTMLEYLQDTEPEPFEDLIYLVSGSWQLGYFAKGEQFGLKLCSYGVKKYGTTSSQAASIRHIMGALYDNWGMQKQAVRWFRSAYENYKDVREPHPFYYALVCHKYGKALRYEREYRESERILYKAQKYLAGQLEEDSRKTDVGYVEEMGAGAFMDIYMELAALYLRWGKPEEALVWLERRKQEFEERKMGRIWEPSQWNLYYQMGICQEMLGNRDQAEKSLWKSMDCAKKYFIKDSHYIHMVKKALIKICDEEGEVR